MHKVGPGVPRGEILVVDDEVAVLRSYAERLHQAGFGVTTARAAAKALELAERTAFDIVISDLRMPGMDGLALLRGLRERAPDVPVILMSDARDHGAAEQAAEQGALQFLVKPVDLDKLVSVANSAVHFHRLTRGRLRVVVTATEAKNEFGRILETAIHQGAVVITKRDAPKAILVALEDLDSLLGAAEGRRKLDTLSAEFDALLARMQSSKARAARKAAFDASPAALGKAAVAAVRKRR